MAILKWKWNYLVWLTDSHSVQGFVENNIYIYQTDIHWSKCLLLRSPGVPCPNKNLCTWTCHQIGNWFFFISKKILYWSSFKGRYNLATHWVVNILGAILNQFNKTLCAHHSKLVQKLMLFKVTVRYVDDVMYSSSNINKSQLITFTNKTPLTW